jgi:DNA-binding response OmpR family regulator
MRNVLPRAVVAEAQYALRRSIAQALKENGYEPVEVENGPQAGEAARRSGPEAVVVNVAVPGLDGFAVCEQVRRLPGGGRIAVILCADRTQPEDVIAAKKCGADGCLTIKPFQKDALLSKIATAQALRKYGGG